MTPLYEEGWTDGRTGAPRKSDEPEYVWGYRDGESAKEFAENGSDREV